MNKKYIENQDYMFTDNPDDKDHYAIKILTGPYEGVIYYYSAIKGITEDDSRLNAILSFEYILIEHLDIITDTNHFITVIGDILSSIITDNNKSENPKERMKLDNEENRIGDTTEFDTE